MAFQQNRTFLENCQTAFTTELMLTCALKGIGLQRISLISDESGWRDKHFAANFMKIGGSVS